MLLDIIGILLIPPTVVAVRVVFTVRACLSIYIYTLRIYTRVYIHIYMYIYIYEPDTFRVYLASFLYFQYYKPS